MEEQFLNILKEELVLALGCTEPTAFAICANKCREILDSEPSKIIVRASGNMIKNVKGVYIPNTKGLKGISNAVIIGALVNSKSNNLQILNDLSDDLLAKASELEASGIVELEKKDTSAKLYIEVEMISNDNTATVEIMHTHTNITKITKNSRQVYYNPCSEDDFNSNLTSRSELNVQKIFDFCNTVDYQKLKAILSPQARYNIEVAKEGIFYPYGLEVGRTILRYSKNDVYDLMKAYASAGSDARMSGCDKTVVINSGSGNQGLTIAIPLEIYRNYEGLSDEQYYRALAMANLIPIHIKTKIGRLSAFCGAVSAAMGVGASLSYIQTNDYNVVCNTISNTIANLTGVICDGAKSTCAIKIASSLDAAFLAHKLAIQGKFIEAGIGITGECVECAIEALSKIANQGMGTTDNVIIDIMTK